MTLKAALHHNRSSHQIAAMQNMAIGLERSGIKSVFAGFNEPIDCDFAVVWSWKQPAVVYHAKMANRPVLVMERGHLQPRYDYISLGWGGLGNHARYPGADVDPDRWKRLWGSMRPWKEDGEYILVMGQCPGDSATNGIDVDKWKNHVIGKLQRLGFNPKFRQHPVIDKNVPPIESDLERASLCVTYNSTSAIEAVLAGVPTVTIDRGSMAWAVSSHQIDDPPIRPDRSAWAEWLACCQWTVDEIKSGAAWDAVKRCMEG